MKLMHEEYAGHAFQIAEKAVENDPGKRWTPGDHLAKLCKCRCLLLPVNSLVQGFSQGIFLL